MRCNMLVHMQKTAVTSAHLLPCDDPTATQGVALHSDAVWFLGADHTHPHRGCYCGRCSNFVPGTNDLYSTSLAGVVQCADRTTTTQMQRNQASVPLNTHPLVVLLQPPHNQQPEPAPPCALRMPD